MKVKYVGAIMYLFTDTIHRSSLPVSVSASLPQTPLSHKNDLKPFLLTSDLLCTFFYNTKDTSL